MEKISRKIKTQYIIAIIIGLLCGLCICYVGDQLLHDPDPDELSSYAFTQRFDLTYDPRTFYSDILVNEPNIFFEMDWSDEAHFGHRETIIPQMWSSEFLMEIPQVAFRELFKEDTSGWYLSSVDYEMKMNDTEITRIWNVTYRYTKACVVKKKETNCIRHIKYQPGIYSLNVHDYAFGPVSHGYDSDDPVITINRDEAFQIAEENSGKQFREEQQLSEYYLDISYSSGSWRIIYDKFPSTPTLWITIDAATGEVIESYITPAKPK